MTKTNRTVTVDPQLDPKVYKTKSPRRHSGPVTAAAVSGTGRRSGKNKKH